MRSWPQDVWGSIKKRASMRGEGFARHVVLFPVVGGRRVEGSWSDRIRKRKRGVRLPGSWCAAVYVGAAQAANRVPGPAPTSIVSGHRHVRALRRSYMVPGRGGSV